MSLLFNTCKSLDFHPELEIEGCDIELQEEIMNRLMSDEDCFGFLKKYVFADNVHLEKK